MKRKWIVAGGSGFIGRHLVNYLRAKGHRVKVLTRHSANLEKDEVKWDGQNPGPWQKELEGADALVNLCGKSVNCRYTRRNRAAIYASRLDSTRMLGIAMAQCEQPPRIWMNASSATIYRHAEDREMDEMSGEIGNGFSVDVCQKWEAEFFGSPLPEVRKVALRSAIVMGPGAGGAFDAFHTLVKFGFGGAQGSGNQFMSWIHIQDFCRSMEWIEQNQNLSGVINLSAPKPISNRNFLAYLRRATGRRVGLPLRKWMLEGGAFVARTETELLLKSRRVIPKRLTDSGFRFRYPTWPDALSHLLAE